MQTDKNCMYWRLSHIVNKTSLSHQKSVIMQKKWAEKKTALNYNRKAYIRSFFQFSNTANTLKNDILKIYFAVKFAVAECIDVYIYLWKRPSPTLLNDKKF
jgi:hypothetical protein